MLSKEQFLENKKNKEINELEELIGRTENRVARALEKGQTVISSFPDNDNVKARIKHLLEGAGWTCVFEEKKVKNVSKDDKVYTVNSVTLRVS